MVKRLFKSLIFKKNRLFRIALVYLRDESLARDAVDDAVYRAWRSITKLKHPEYFKTWITRILVNCCNKTLQKRKHETVLESLPEQPTIDPDTLEIHSAVAALPDDLRLIIPLRFFSDLTISQISDMLKIPEGTVKTRQRKALSLLKLELEEEL